MGVNLLQGLGAAKPVSEFINTATNFQQSNQNMQLQQLQLADLQRKQEDADRLINLDDIPTKFAGIGQASTGKAIHGFASVLGSVQEVPAPDGTVKRFIRKGDLKQAMSDYDGLAKNAPQHVLAVGWAGYEDAMSKVNTLQADGARGKPVSPTDLEAAKKAADVALSGYRELHRTLAGKEEPKPNVYKPGDFVEQPGGGYLQMPTEAKLGKPEGVVNGRYVYTGPQGVTFGDGSPVPDGSPINPYKPTAQWVDETRVVGGKKVEGQRNTETNEWKSRVQGGVTVNMGDQLDKESARALIKTLPKLKEEAVSASGNLQRIDEMNALLDKGFGGRMGQVKAWLAPWAEAAGIDVKGMGEAQTYELLAQTLGGSMRMSIVGPGQVSNFEQQMLQKVNAGGRAATPAARELLKYYRDIAARKVADYNDSVDSVSTMSPATAKLYRKINVKGITPATGGVTTAEEFLKKKGLQ